MRVIDTPLLLRDPGTSRSFQLKRSHSTGKKGICSPRPGYRLSDETDLWFLKNDLRKEKRPEKERLVRFDERAVVVATVFGLDREESCDFDSRLCTGG